LRHLPRLLLLDNTKRENAMSSKLTFDFNSIGIAIVIGAVMLTAGAAHAVELNPAAVNLQAA
jgi:hypothetical protein